jgi:hypothetical protein
LLQKKLKIKSRATANSDFQENCIFGGFRFRLYGASFLKELPNLVIAPDLDAYLDEQFPMVCLGACENKYFSLHEALRN